MATYRARLSAEPGGGWIASSVELPHCWSRGTTRDEALGKLRDEIRYRIELCPCSGVDDAYVQVELEVSGPAGARRGGTETRAARPPVAALSGVAGCPPEQTQRPQTDAPERASETSRAPGWRRWDD